MKKDTMVYTDIRYYIFDDYKLDVVNSKLFKEDTHIPLSPKCFEILLFLVQNNVRVVSKEELLEKFWEQTHVEEKNLVQHLYKIRRALKSNGEADRYIETSSKNGYKFIAELKIIPSESATNQLSDEYHKGNYLLSSENGISTVAVSDEFENEASEIVRTHPNNEILPSQKYSLLRSRKVVITGIAVLLAIILPIGGYYYFSSKTDAKFQDIKSIAVLPFKQIGGNPDEKIGLGIADTLISQLSNQKKVSIFPTSTIISFVGNEDEDPVRIGRKLRVDGILTGTIQRENETVRVNVQLISVSEETSLWADKFDASFSNIFTLQDEIARQIAEKLFLDTEEETKSTNNKKGTNNVEAYQAYSMGLFYWNKRTKDELSKAVKHFRTAIENDPKYAIAYAMLADTYAVIAQRELDSSERKKILSTAKKMAEKALQLDPKSSEAYCALGLIFLREREKARGFLNRALKLNSNNATAHLRLANLYFSERDLEKTISEMKLAQEIDPISLQINSLLAYALTLNRQPDEALKFFLRAEQVSTSFGPKIVLWKKILIIKIYEQQKDYKRADDELSKLLNNNRDDPDILLLMSRIQAKMNNSEKAEKLFKEYVSKEIERKPNYDVALASIYLKKTDEALDILRQINGTSSFLMTLENDYNLDPIRNMSEFKNILAKVRSGVEGD